MKSKNSFLSFKMVVMSLLVCCSFYMTAQESTDVKVTAVYKPSSNQHLFQLSTDTIPSGWTTFKFVNASPAVHFMVLEDFPGKRTTEDVKREVGPIFQGAMDLIIEGKTDEGYAKLGELPEWFSSVKFRGGSGLTMPGNDTQFTTYLVPGNYGIECYVKAEDGTFHSMMGMFEDLYVTQEANGNPEPQTADIDIFPSYNGYSIVGNLTPGKHLVAVHFMEAQKGALGNDVHIIRMRDDTDIKAVTNWIDWTQPEGLVSGHMGNSPIPAEFLGGSQEAPVGSTTYFTITLDPGKYAIVSEQPANAPIYKLFTIAEDGVSGN